MSHNYNIIIDADKPHDNLDSTNLDLEFQNKFNIKNTHQTTYFGKYTILSIRFYSKFFNI
ncbi:hypothetical protein PCK1_002004 [Pneumocystis canis]|nr:hypothetical protein PCK1_002004 [Pneumocystis canis]